MESSIRSVRSTSTWLGTELLCLRACVESKSFNTSTRALRLAKENIMARTITMTWIIESIGGPSQIILAYRPGGGHAYTVACLGKAGKPESDVRQMISWLRKKCGVKEINIQTDLKDRRSLAQFGLVEGAWWSKSPRMAILSCCQPKAYSCP